MKKNLFFIACIVGNAIAPVFSQKIEKEFLYAMNFTAGDRIAFEGFDYNPTNESCIVYFTRQQLGSMVENGLREKGARYYSSFASVGFDKEMTKTIETYDNYKYEGTKEAYKLNYVTYNILGKYKIEEDKEIGNSSTDKDFDWLKKKYKTATSISSLDKSIETKISVNRNLNQLDVVLTSHQYTYDKYCNCLIDTKKDQKQTLLIQREDAALTNLIGNPIIGSENKFTSILGSVKKKGSPVYSDLKEYSVTTFNSENKQVNQVDVAYDFVKMPLFAGEVKKDNQTVGSLFIFGRWGSLGKKVNDLDKTLYNLVYTNEKGQLVSNYKFNIGEEGTTFYTDYAFVNDNVLFVFGKLSGATNSRYVLLKFNDQGLETIKTYDNPTIQAGTKANNDQGLKVTAGAFMNVERHIISSSGEILLIGTTKSLQTDQASIVNGIEFELQKKYSYGNYVILHLSTDGTLKGQYCFEKKVANYASNLYHSFQVDFTDKRLLMVYTEPTGEFSNYFKECNVEFINEQGLRSKKAKDSHRSTSFVLAVDLVNANANRLNLPSPNFTNYYAGSFHYDKQNNKLLFFGYTFEGHIGNTVAIKIKL